MMQSDNCRCPHHWVTKVFRVLAGVSAVLFFWTILKDTVVWNFPFGAWFEFFIVFALLTLSMKGSCKCCCGDKHCNTCSVKPM